MKRKTKVFTIIDVSRCSKFSVRVISLASRSRSRARAFAYFHTFFLSLVALCSRNFSFDRRACKKSLIVSRDKLLRNIMRVKRPPRQHRVDMNVETSDKNESITCNAKISRSEPCLRFVNGDLEITMERVASDHQYFQDSGPGIDEALDLAMPTRSRCKHERYSSCFSLGTSLESAVSDDQLEAIDLSTQDNRGNVEITRPQSELKTTFLYKMLTDSSFLENLRGSKQTTSGPACPYCKKHFSKDDELTDHLNVRKDESNQVACCACGKTFAQKRYLRYHQRCHSERSKFTCDICTKNYSRLDNLTRHNNFHTNPDKFPCTSCDRTFARKDLFKKHIKCHENRHRYYCSICDKYFKGPLSLENHKKLVHLNL